jgi:hypothetical protein
MQDKYEYDDFFWVLSLNLKLEEIIWNVKLFSSEILQCFISVEKF